MAIKLTNPRDTREIDFIPQAIISRSKFEALPQGRDVKFVQDEDDFDRYEGVVFFLDDKLPFALRHYRGHPDDTLTIYLANTIRNVESITSIIWRILSEFHLPKEALIWERRDEPDL